MLDLFTKEQVAAFLYDKRREKKLTGKEVSKKLEMFDISITPTTIYGYEKGVSGPTVQTFMALCKIYEVDDVIAEVQAKHQKVSLNSREITLVEYFRAASPELQDAALRILAPVEKENTASSVG